MSKIGVFNAIKQGDICTLTSKLEENPDFASASILFKWTVMHELAQRGRATMIELLVRFGSTTIDTPGYGRMTPMHTAAWNGHVSAIETLVRLGSTAIDTLDKRGRSPLYTALLREKWECVEVLKELGADCSITHLDSLTPTQFDLLNKPIDESKSAETRYRAYFNRSCVSRLLFHLDTVKRPSSPSTRHLLE